MRLYRYIFTFFITLLLSGTVFAHGPTPKKASHTIEISKSPSEVWEVLGKFGDIAQWHPLVTASEEFKDEKDPGSLHRKLTMKNGESFTESLDFIDNDNHEYIYRQAEMNLKALPVSSYTANMAVTEEDGKTVVSWKARFYRGDTGNTPPENLNDEAAIKAMNEFIETGLNGLKEFCEK